MRIHGNVFALINCQEVHPTVSDANFSSSSASLVSNTLEIIRFAVF